MGALREPRDGIGPLIGVLRERHGVSHSDLVRRAKVSSASLSNYESGKRRVPAVVVKRVADALGVSICDLYGVDETHAVRSGSGKTAALVARLVQALEANPDRVEVNVYSASAPTATLPGARSTRRLIDEYHDLPEDRRQEWRELAEAIRAEEKGE